MVLLRDIKGQENAVKYLNNCLESGRVSKSYLFSGPQGVGRALAAKAFIMSFFCQSKDFEGNACLECPACARAGSLSHPDVTWIKPEKNKKIKIEQVRQIKDILNLKPYEAPLTVCIIEDAHMMTIEASNALLKVLEEPPDESLIILISNKKELLLETVISRCTEVRFRYLPISDTKEIISANSGIDEDTAYFLACFSQGSPGMGLEMIEEGVLERKKGVVDTLENIMIEKESANMVWDEDNKNNLLEDLEMLIMIFRDVALAKEGAGDMVIDKDIADTGFADLFKAYSIDKMYGIVEDLVKLKLALIRNVNPKLVAQVLPGVLR